MISGLANDFIQYFVTPEEYDRQHYEGGSTLFGRATSVFVEERLIALLELMIAGEPAPPPDEDQRRNGISDDAAAVRERRERRAGARDSLRKRAASTAHRSAGRAGPTAPIVRSTAPS